MEKIKRLTYIIISILSITLPIVFNILHIPNIIWSVVFHLLSYILISILLVIITNLVYSISTGDSFTIRFIPFIVGILMINLKRIYYAELGYFYISKYGDNIALYKQELLYCKEILTTKYLGDIDSLRIDLKINLDRLYKEEISKRKEEVRRKEAFKNWDGYLDTQSKRDDKINSII